MYIHQLTTNNNLACMKLVTQQHVERNMTVSLVGGETNQYPHTWWTLLLAAMKPETKLFSFSNADSSPCFCCYDLGKGERAVRRPLRDAAYRLLDWGKDLDLKLKKVGNYSHGWSTYPPLNVPLVSLNKAGYQTHISGARGGLG